MFSPSYFPLPFPFLERKKEREREKKEGRKEGGKEGRKEGIKKFQSVEWAQVLDGLWNVEVIMALWTRCDRRDSWDTILKQDNRCVLLSSPNESKLFLILLLMLVEENIFARLMAGPRRSLF